MKRLVTIFSALALTLVGGLPALAAPSVPSSVVVVSNSAPNTAIGSASLKVTWRASTGAVTYNVSATDPLNVSKSTSNPCVATECTAILVGLTGGTKYSVKVTAVANDGTLAAATAVDFTAVSVPGAPTVVSATSVAGEAALVWTPGENIGGKPLTGYVITEKDGKVPALTVNATSTSLNVDSVVAGQSYVFRVAAVNENGTSATDEFAPLIIKGVPVAPAAPTVTVTGSTVSVGWVAPLDQGAPITGYKVYLVDSSGIDVGLPTLAATTTASLANLSAGTYKVQVVATNSVGDSTRSTFSNEFRIGNGTQANAPVFTPNALVAMDVGATQSMTVVAPSGGDVTITLTASPSGACTYTAGVITAVSAGTCTFAVTAAGNATYAVGTASRTVTVKAQQTISFSPIAAQTMPGPFTVSATATSGLAVRFAVTGDCTVVSRTISFTGAGTCNVTASQPGNSSFSAAQSVVRSFSITGSSGSVELGGGGGGGFSGGGGGSGPMPTPAPVVTEKPTPTPTKSPTPTPSATPVKLSDSATVSTSLASATVIAIAGSKATTAIKLGKSVAVKLTAIPKGTKVASSLKNAKGVVFALPTKAVGANKIYTTVAVKPKVRGTYTLTVSYGKVRKTLVIVVK